LLPAELDCIELASPSLREKKKLKRNWKTSIAARADNTAGNENTSVFTEAWLPEKGIDQRFQTLTGDPDMILFATDSNKKLLVIHSFKNAGGTLLHPEKKLSAFRAQEHLQRFSK
jgi:hypothetical protein